MIEALYRCGGKVGGRGKSRVKLTRFFTKKWKNRVKFRLYLVAFELEIGFIREHIRHAEEGVRGHIVVLRGLPEVIPFAELLPHASPPPEPCNPPLIP